jgi:transcriptional regulator with XRE-family HTH domain
MRQANGWTQAELAYLTHMHAVSIGKIEKGQRKLGVATLMRVAGALEPAGLTRRSSSGRSSKAAQR